VVGVAVRPARPPFVAGWPPKEGKV